MVATIIKRKSRLQILRDKRLELARTSKTGIHSNPVVNAAIDDIESRSRGSGNGTAPASTTIPLLLQKRQELRQRDEFEGDND